MKKPFYKSRTLWMNLLFVIAFIAQSQFGFVISPEVQAAVLALLNFVLRLDTDSAVTM